MDKIYKICSTEEYDLLVEKFGKEYWKTSKRGCLSALGMHSEIAIFPRSISLSGNYSSNPEATKKHKPCLEIVSFDEAMAENFNINTGDKFEAVRDEPFCISRLKKGGPITVTKILETGGFLGKIPGDIFDYIFRNDPRQIKKIKSKTSMTLREQIELAKSYLGKTIEYSEGISNTVSGIVLGTDTNAQVGGAYTDRAEKQIAKNGFFVSIWLKESKGFILIDDQTPNFKIHEPIMVNGFEAKDRGDSYGFGCAKIGKESLKAAKTFLETVKSDGTNKPVEFVEIGAGKFTLEILNKLV